MQVKAAGAGVAGSRVSSINEQRMGLRARLVQSGSMFAAMHSDGIDTSLPPNPTHAGVWLSMLVLLQHVETAPCFPLCTELLLCLPTRF